MNVQPNDNVSELDGYDLILSLVQTLIALAQFVAGPIATSFREAFYYLQSFARNTHNVTIQFLSPILLPVFAIIFLSPTVRDAIKRRTHHLFPTLFLHNPPRGPRHIPNYLLTDGLTREHTLVPPHKGECTYHQLQHHTVANAGYKVCLIPTTTEALAGLHPGCNLQVSVPARPPVVQLIENDFQLAINNGTSEASTALNLILRVRHHLTNVTRPKLVSLRRPPGKSLSSLVLTHPFGKEVSIALKNILSLPTNKRKLGALYHICQDQHVLILQTEFRNRNHRRRRLDDIYGVAAINALWIDVPH